MYKLRCSECFLKVGQGRAGGLSHHDDIDLRSVQVEGLWPEESGVNICSQIRT